MHLKRRIQDESEWVEKSTVRRGMVVISIVARMMATSGGGVGVFYKTIEKRNRKANPIARTPLRGTNENHPRWRVPRSIPDEARRVCKVAPLFGSF
jgi:hypothetical protein